MVDQRDRDARHVQLLHRRLDERRQLGDPRGIEPVRDATGELLAAVTGGTQTLADQRERGAALLGRRLAAFDDHDGPRVAMAQRDRLHRDVLVGWHVVRDDGARVPAVARRDRRR